MKMELTGSIGNTNLSICIKNNRDFAFIAQNPDSELQVWKGDYLPDKEST